MIFLISFPGFIQGIWHTLYSLVKLCFDLGKCFIPNYAIARALFCNFGGVNGSKPRWAVAEDCALGPWMCGREISEF
jgi:hypothetical protein